MKKILLISICIIISIITSCANKKNREINKRDTLFGKYVYQSESEKIEVTLSEDSTGLMIDNEEQKTFKWHVHKGIIAIEEPNDSALETYKYTFNGEYLTISKTKFKKQ